MKKIINLLLLSIILVCLVSCATMKPMEPMEPIEPNQDLEFIALTERASESIEERLSAENMRFASIQWDNWMQMARRLGHERALYRERPLGSTYSRVDLEYQRRYGSRYEDAYQNAMREFIEVNYLEAINEHNRRAPELRREWEERDQRLRHEMQNAMSLLVFEVLPCKRHFRSCT